MTNLFQMNLEFFLSRVSEEETQEAFQDLIEYVNTGQNMIFKDILENQILYVCSLCGTKDLPDEATFCCPYCEIDMCMICKMTHLDHTGSESKLRSLEKKVS